MRRFTWAIIGLIRTLVVLTALWLVIEVFHFRSTGEYILYYRLWLRSAKNAMEEIAIVHQIYNVWTDRLDIGFTAYFVPITRLLAFLIASCDAVIVIHVPDRKRIIFGVLSVVACLTIACITLMPTIY